MTGRALGAVVALVGACGRIDFMAGDGPIATDGRHDALNAEDAPANGALAALVQTVATDVASGAVSIDGAIGLSPVTAGDMVLVVCGTPDQTGPCTPTSSPSATWTSLDLGSSLSAYYACGAPAITSITLANGNKPAAAIVSEWRGLVTSACLDQKKISVGCQTSTWAVDMANDTLQNKELLVVLGMAENDGTPWTIDTPYAVTQQKIAAGNTVAVLAAAALADPALALPTASGTVGPWSVNCFDDLFSFEAVQ